MKNHDQKGFNEIAEALYTDLQRALVLCDRSHPSTLTRIECCFQKAVCYQSLLNKKTGGYRFQKKEEAIQFFKTIKPLFGAEVEYQALLYHLHLFITGSNKADATDLMSRESNRLQKIIRQHSSLYHYYKSGAAYADEQYFLQPVCPQVKGLEQEGEPALTEARGYDEVLALIIAHERYHGFLEIMMKG